MKKHLIMIGTLAALAALSASPAAAATPVSCSQAVNALLDNEDDVHWLNVKGARVTARGGLGFSSFTMSDGYQVEDDPLHTPDASLQSMFGASRIGTDAFAGYFHEVFPARGNGDEDRWRLWVGRNGNFWLLSVTWSQPWALMKSPVCYEGPQGQLLVTGYFEVAGWTLDFWTFVMQGAQFI